MGSMKVHQVARGLCWDQQEVASLTLGCKRLRPLAPKQIILTTPPSPPPPNFDLKTFIRPDCGPRKHLLPHSHDTSSTTTNKDNINNNNNPPPSPQQQVEITHPGGTRWNPTQEQIGILEMLYRGGMRTPNAEQIEQITGQLSKYGKIEGKNVFYWFQNHKARERQKQKRNTMSMSMATARAEEEQDSSSPYKKRCRPRTWAFECLLLEHTTMPMPMPPSHNYTHNQQEQHTTTLELFPLHPEGR